MTRRRSKRELERAVEELEAEEEAGEVSLTDVLLDTGDGPGET